MNDLSKHLSSGTLTSLDGERILAHTPWTAHPVFKGVSMKHLIRANDTAGRLSAHMVSLEPGAVLDSHVHESQYELHEVLHGKGCFHLEDKEVVYEPGSMGIIPMGTNHKVVAGETGLVILAKFFPALL